MLLRLFLKLRGSLSLKNHERAAPAPGRSTSGKGKERAVSDTPANVNRLLTQEEIQQALSGDLELTQAEADRIAAATYDASRYTASGTGMQNNRNVHTADNGSQWLLIKPADGEAGPSDWTERASATAKAAMDETAQLGASCEHKRHESWHADLSDLPNGQMDESVYLSECPDGSQYEREISPETNLAASALMSMSAGDDLLSQLTTQPKEITEKLNKYAEEAIKEAARRSGSVTDIDQLNADVTKNDSDQKTNAKVGTRSAQADKCRLLRRVKNMYSNKSTKKECWGRTQVMDDEFYEKNGYEKWHELDESSRSAIQDGMQDNFSRWNWHSLKPRKTVHEPLSPKSQPVTPPNPVEEPLELERDAQGRQTIPDSSALDEQATESSSPPLSPNLSRAVNILRRFSTRPRRQVPSIPRKRSASASSPEEHAKKNDSIADTPVVCSPTVKAAGIEKRIKRRSGRNKKAAHNESGNDGPADVEVLRQSSLNQNSFVLKEES